MCPQAETWWILLPNKQHFFSRRKDLEKLKYGNPLMKSISPPAPLTYTVSSQSFVLHSLFTASQGSPSIRIWGQPLTDRVEAGTSRKQRLAIVCLSTPWKDHLHTFTTLQQLGYGQASSFGALDFTQEIQRIRHRGEYVHHPVAATVAHTPPAERPYLCAWSLISLVCLLCNLVL